MGLNSTLSSYSQRRSEKQRGGGGGGGNLGFPGSRLVSVDLDPRGHPTQGQNGPFQLLLFCEFMYVPSSLPTYQAVVIQQFSIG